MQNKEILNQFPYLETLHGWNMDFFLLKHYTQNRTCWIVDQVAALHRSIKYGSYRIADIFDQDK